MLGVLDTIGEGCLIDEDLIVRIMDSFDRADADKIPHTSRVTVWQFLRQHEGVVVRVVLEPAPQKHSDLIYTRAARLTDDDLPLRAELGPSAVPPCPPRISSNGWGTARFMVAAMVLCILVSVMVPLLLRR